MKKQNRKGFTLAELLIVVAIIAVLVAIAIPIFNGQLQRARETADEGNIRAAYAYAIAQYFEDGKTSEKDSDWALKKVGIETADGTKKGKSALNYVSNLKKWSWGSQQTLVVKYEGKKVRFSLGVAAS